jgi:hypothetical protein
MQKTVRALALAEETVSTGPALAHALGLKGNRPGRRLQVRTRTVRTLRVRVRALGRRARQCHVNRKPPRIAAAYRT